MFLDEIGDCPLELQAQLLRVLDNGEVMRLGESSPRRVDVRVIGATLRDEDSFRPDLRERFQRMIVLPTLRERREDIPLLVRHWVIRQAKEDPGLERFLFLGPTNEMEVRVNPLLIDYLVRNPPPRNVRQLNNILAEAADASPGDELMLPSSLPSPKTTPPAAPERIEVARRARRGPNDPDPTREETLAALRAVAHNFTQAADVLGVHRNTLKRLVEKYGISRDETLP